MKVPKSVYGVIAGTVIVFSFVLNPNILAEAKFEILKLQRTTAATKSVTADNITYSAIV